MSYYNTPPGKCPDCKGSGVCECQDCQGRCRLCGGTGDDPWPEEEEDATKNAGHKRGVK